MFTVWGTFLRLGKLSAFIVERDGEKWAIMQVIIPSINVSTSYQNHLENNLSTGLANVSTTPALPFYPVKLYIKIV